MKRERETRYTTRSSYTRIIRIYVHGARRTEHRKRRARLLYHVNCFVGDNSPPFRSTFKLNAFSVSGWFTLIRRPNQITHHLLFYRIKRENEFRNSRALLIFIWFESLFVCFFQREITGNERCLNCDQPNHTFARFARKTAIYLGANVQSNWNKKWACRVSEAWDSLMCVNTQRKLPEAVRITCKLILTVNTPNGQFAACVFFAMHVKWFKRFISRTLPTARSLLAITRWHEISSRNERIDRENNPCCGRLSALRSPYYRVKSKQANIYMEIFVDAALIWKKKKHSKMQRRRRWERVVCVKSAPMASHISSRIYSLYLPTCTETTRFFLTRNIIRT